MFLIITLQCSLLLLSISLFKGFCHKVILSKLSDQHYNSNVQLLVKYGILL